MGINHKKCFVVKKCYSNNWNVGPDSAPRDPPKLYHKGPSIYYVTQKSTFLNPRNIWTAPKDKLLGLDEPYLTTHYDLK